MNPALSVQTQPRAPSWHSLHHSEQWQWPAQLMPEALSPRSPTAGHQEATSVWTGRRCQSRSRLPTRHPGCGHLAFPASLPHWSTELTSRRIAGGRGCMVSWPGPWRDPLAERILISHNSKGSTPSLPQSLILTKHHPADLGPLTCVTGTADTHHSPQVPHQEPREASRDSPWGNTLGQCT